MTSMYWRFRCIPRHAEEVHNATQAETLQVWHERTGHQNKRHVMKVLMQRGIHVEAKSIVTVALSEKHIDRTS